MQILLCFFMLPGGFLPVNSVFFLFVDSPYTLILFIFVTGLTILNHMGDIVIGLWHCFHTSVRFNYRKCHPLRQSVLICACMCPGQPPYWRCISCINLIWLELFLGVRLSRPSAADVLFCQAYLLWLVKPISLSLYQPLQCSAGIYASEELDSEEIMLQITDCIKAIVRFYPNVCPFSKRSRALVTVSDSPTADTPAAQLNKYQ